MTTYDQHHDRVGSYPQSTDETHVGLLPPAGEPSYPETPEDDAFDREDRQRRQYGGINWGAGFFGWLVTVSVTVLLSGVAAAALTVAGVTVDSLSTALASDPRNVGLAVAGVCAAVVLLSYFTGGYVAGRMSRFDGSRQGFGLWVNGLLLTGALVGLGLLFGTPPETLQNVDVSTLAFPAWTRGLGGAITTVAALLGSLLAAMAGGKLGCRYHRKVDAAAYR